MRSLPNPTKYLVGAADQSTVTRLLNGAKISESGCFEWQGALDRHGYGVIKSCGAVLGTHRLAYWLAHGPIDGLLAVDHLCFNTRCMEPTHLRLLPLDANSARQPPSNRRADRTHCVHGHALSGENVYVYYRNGSLRRVCRTCRRSRERSRLSRQAALSAE